MIGKKWTVANQRGKPENHIAVHRITGTPYRCTPDHRNTISRYTGSPEYHIAVHRITGTPFRGTPDHRNTISRYTGSPEHLIAVHLIAEHHIAVHRITGTPYCGTLDRRTPYRGTPDHRNTISRYIGSPQVDQSFVSSFCLQPLMKSGLPVLNRQRAKLVKR